MKKTPCLFILFFLIIQKTFSQVSYNLYWGHYQAKLEQNNQYHASIKVKYLEFNNIITTPPYLWDGSKMLDFSFKINKIAFQNIDFMAYKEAIVALENTDKDFLSKTLRLDSISLDNKLFGTIDIEITDYFEETKAEISTWRSAIIKEQVNNFDDYNIHLQHGVLSYRWGKYIVHGERPHTYIGVSQFLETVKDVPELLRSNEFPHEPIKAQIVLQKDTRNTTVFSFLLNSHDNYQDFYQNLLYQKRLFKPNTLVYIVFDVDKTDLNLATHRLIIVADDDPRLKLQQSDYQIFTLKWGADFAATKEKVFLKTLISSKGDTVHADPKEAIFHSFNIKEEIDKENGNLELSVNGKKIEQWTCQFATEGKDEVSFSYDNSTKLSESD